jgi:hypothetical protein
MESKEEKGLAKRAYEKPKLRTIELVAEEVLAIGCKINGSADVNVGQPSCGIGVPCNQNGS